MPTSGPGSTPGQFCLSGVAGHVVTLGSHAGRSRSAPALSRYEAVSKSIVVSTTMPSYTRPLPYEFVTAYGVFE